MNIPRVLFGLRLFFFLFATVTNIILGVLLAKRKVTHEDISWWLFSLETFALMYYALVELCCNRLAFGRLSILGIIGSAIATQGVLANSVEPTVSRVLSILVTANLGFVFSIGTRLKLPSIDDEEPPVPLTKDRLKAHLGESSIGEITPIEEDKEKQEIVEDFKWKDVFSESSESSESVATETAPFCVSPDTISLGFGICGLVLGLGGWVLNLSIWIHECLNKDTCSELGPQWWTLIQTSMLFVMYIISVGFNKTFETMATYCVLWAVPVSIFLRVANTARSDFFYLKNQEDTYHTWDSDGTIVGSSLIAASGALLLISLGILHYSWKAPAPEYTRSFRAIISLTGLLGLVIFGIGLRNAQQETCQHNDQLCQWYDGLWVDICFEIVIVLFGIHSVFTQPGESIRAILIALTVLPSYTYTINITRFLEHWDLESSDELDRRWAVRFSATGLIILSCVNYAWMFAWGWGNSESLESTLPKGYKSSLSTSLLKSAKSVAYKSTNKEIMNGNNQGLELGVFGDDTKSH